MNTRRVIDDSVGPAALSVSFNADNSCFSVSLENGFRVYKTVPCQLDKIRDFGSGIGSAEMLGKTNYVALVGGGKQPKFPQNKVIIWDEAKEKAAITLEFRTAVQRVRLSRSRIIVVLLNSINLYKFSTSVENLSTFDTANNPYGLCCLGKELFAFPGRTPGQVQLVRLSNSVVSIIPAHSSPLSAIDLSPDGEVLATASENGTLIRVWSTSSSNKIAELRRGVDPASIFSLSISPSNTMLAVTSDKSTLHIFDLPYPSHSQEQPSSSQKHASPQGREMAQGEREGSPNKQKWGLLSKLPLMPRVFSDTYSFASAHFEIGEEPVPSTNRSPTWNAPIPGVPGGRPPKGIIGWVSDDSLVVLGAGQDARWEKFLIGPAEDGTRVCWREGWRKYMD